MKEDNNGGLDLNNPEAVFERFQAGTRFDWELYIENLPIGQRLLTRDEVDDLPEEEKRPAPEMDDPEWWSFYFDSVTGDNGGGYLWQHNWDPINSRPVYPDAAIPFEMRVMTDISDGEDKGRKSIDAFVELSKIFHSK